VVLGEVAMMRKLGTGYHRLQLILGLGCVKHDFLAVALTKKRRWRGEAATMS